MAINQLPSQFPWPGGKRAAVSLSFDDARPSEVDVGLPILDRYGVKASFYIIHKGVEQRLDGWKRAAKNGHELGNHTVTHPCSGNYAFSRNNPLEDYTLERMESELLKANELTEKIFGLTPRTHAYCCGQKFVGRGADVKSYVPLVARHFIAGRSFRESACNDPWFCDLTQAFGMDFDCTPFETAWLAIENALERGGWVIFVGHEVGVNLSQGVWNDTLEKICQRCIEPSSGIWIDTVASVASFILDARKQSGLA